MRVGEGTAEPRPAEDARLEWAFLGRRVLVLSRHLPAQDGIARYTDQLLKAIADDREIVRLGIPGGGGDQIIVPWGWLRPLRLLRHGRGFDEVLVMYHPTTFHRGGMFNRLASYASLALVARALPLTVLVHEDDDLPPEDLGRRGRAAARAVEWMRRRFWAGVPRLVFHTEWEQRRHAERFPAHGRDERLVAHESAFTPAVTVTRSEARARLGLPADGVILAALGFLSPHKGVDGVVRALERAHVDGVDLHIVGSPISDWPEVLEHVKELRAIAARSPEVHLHELFVSDEEFDLWICAADAVVVAYRSAASSSVVARTRLHGTALFTSAAGGINEQAGPEDVRFANEDDLADAIRRLAPTSAAGVAAAPVAVAEEPAAPARGDPQLAAREWAFLGTRVLHVSRHVPAEDGIANYADQLEAAVSDGRTFTRLGVPFGGGDRVLELWGGFKPLRLLRAARSYDDLLIQYIPWYFIRGGLSSRIASYTALAIVAMRSRATWVVHEEDERLPEEIGRRGRMRFAFEEAVRRLFWGSAARLVFHSEWERGRFAERYPARRARDEKVVTHGASFASPVSASEGEARARLGLPPEAPILLCIGTLSPHKGVDRVVEAVGALGESGLELHIVGRPIRRSPEVDRYAAELRALAARTPGVELHELYVSDDEFDLWIRAVDAVVVAYRTAASSGVVERAHLLGTRLITSGVGGIAEQERPGDTHFDSDEELREAIKSLIGHGDSDG